MLSKVFLPIRIALLEVIREKYFISAGMFDRSRQFLDWVEFGEMFEIEHAYSDGRLFEPRLGATLQQVQWEKIH